VFSRLSLYYGEGLRRGTRLAPRREKFLAARWDGMTILITFLPALVLLFVLMRWNTQRAFLDVYLPVMIILPQYIQVRYTHFPPLNAVVMAALVLGIGMALKDLSRWKFSRSDVWLGMYLVTTAFADIRYGRAADGMLSVFDDLCVAVVPYMAAKLLIEPEQRVATVKRVVWCLFLAMLPSMWEFFSVQNPFRLLFSRFFKDQGVLQATQVRWGFGRISGPYPEAELAGMVLFAGIVLAVWLAYWHLWEPKFKNLEQLPFKKAHIILAVLLVALAMTESRGPWIGLGLSLAVAYVGRAQQLTQKTLIVGALLVAAAIPGYLIGDQYLSGPATTTEQEAAQYRKSMLTNYMPIAVFGGAFGWGESFPKIYTQGSIDNEYLLVDLTRGYLGLTAFLLLSIEGWYAFARTGLRTRSVRDRHFSFTQLGIFTGLLFTIATVYLGSQTYTMFFLLVGWSQAIGVGTSYPITRAVRSEGAVAGQPLVRVYT
jgi:hypothetical protein